MKSQVDIFRKMKNAWSAYEVMVLDEGVILPVSGSDSLIKAHQLM